MMEKMHITWEDRDLVKKRIPDGLMSGNVAAFPAATKSLFWCPAPASRPLRGYLLFCSRDPKSWHELWELPLCNLRLKHPAVCFSAHIFVLLLRDFNHLLLTYFIISHFFFNPQLVSTFKKKGPDLKQTHTPACWHTHKALHHKSHSQGLGGGVWECEPA